MRRCNSFFLRRQKLIVMEWAYLCAFLFLLRINVCFGWSPIFFFLLTE
jgi:hypothetical protein